MIQKDVKVFVRTNNTIFVSNYNRTTGKTFKPDCTIKELIEWLAYFFGDICDLEEWQVLDTKREDKAYEQIKSLLSQKEVSEEERKEFVEKQTRKILSFVGHPNKISEIRLYVGVQLVRQMLKEYDAMRRG